MKINLGSGWDTRPGYVNVDFAPHHSPDVVGDVLHLPFLTGSAEELLAQDVLEHLPRTATQEALTEWRRVTRTGGRIHARFPSLFHAVDLMRRIGTLDGHRLLIQNLYGTQAYTGDVHLTSFTDLTVAEDFHAAGYRDVRAELVDEWMWDVIAGAVDAPPIAVFWGYGIYPIEGSADHTWRWVGPHWELSIVNTGTDTGTVTIRGMVRAEHDRRGRVRVTAGEQSWTGRNGKRLEVNVPVPANSRTALSFESQFVRCPAPRDPRTLHYQISDLVVELG